jgi:maleylpyruvate isomerase
VKLFTYWRSTSAWRVRIALAWKGIPYTSEAVHLLKEGGGQNKAAFRELNAAGQVPVLELDEPAGPGGVAGPLRIAQSMAILEFLEERFPSPALLPADPWLRARARQLAEIVNTGIQPLQNLSTTQRVKDVLHGDPDAWTRHFITRGLGVLESTAAETAGGFLVGDAPSFADVYLVPQLYAARRYAVDLGPYPTLTRAEAACQVLPAFQVAHADAQPDAPAQRVS